MIPTGEVTSWWAFHNGTEPLHDATHRVTRSFWLLSLEQALEQRRIHLRVAQMGAAGLDLTPDEYYNPDWIPVLEDVSGRSVTIDCRPNLPTAVRIVDFHDRPESFHTVFFSSLTEMAAYWAFLIETGQWKWNPELNEWRTRRDFEKIPEELRWSGLV